MIIFANGAYKSGSTWLYLIVKFMSGFGPPPAKYLNPDWVLPSINPDLLGEFISAYDHSDNNILIKTHFGAKEQKDLMLGGNNVFVLNIRRDIRDVIVSAYYHIVRTEDYRKDFKDYFWERGILTGSNVIKYHKMWDISNKRYFCMVYEDLIKDFRTQVRCMAQFLGLELTENTIEIIEENTSFRKLHKNAREKNNLRFFRKGIIGDYQSHFDSDMINKVKEIEMQG